MKRNLEPILFVLLSLFCGQSLFAQQAKPEAANATKAAKRAWEDAPAEKKALWQQHRDALINIDLADDTQRQIVIARGSAGPLRRTIRFAAS